MILSLAQREAPDPSGAGAGGPPPARAWGGGGSNEAKAEGRIGWGGVDVDLQRKEGEAVGKKAKKDIIIIMTFETVPRVFKGRGKQREALPREVRLGRAGRG